MVFSSLPFIYIFMPLFFLLYYISPYKIKNFILLIFSLIFYAWGEPVYILLMILTTFINYIAGKRIEKSKTKKAKKTYLILNIIISLIFLGFFKYGNFLIENLNNLFSVSITPLSLSLPIGISFYTFQAISYVIDVYRNEVKAEKSFLNLMTYIAMFPQLIAGPIVRYETINEELHERKITYEKFSSGFMRFIRGLGKKVLIANNIGLLFSIASNTNQPSILLSWLGIIAYALQIYFDFSGYSDMGIGLGKMLGFSFLENFNYPYIAKNITDFWRRWHISLSTFFKDYVYIPLGGNRCSKLKNIRNILIVWLLTGLWHGAAWNFIIWGLFYGILLIIEKFVLKKYLDKLPNILQHTYALFFILISWLIFAFDDISALTEYFIHMFGGKNIPLINNEAIYYLKNFSILLLISIVLSTPLIKIVAEKFMKNQTKIIQIIVAVISGLIYISILLLSTAYLVDNAYNPFLYFRF